MIKFTVITVCYNAEKTIQQTMNSVIEQDYYNIEYLIVDGMSGDQTIHIANKIKNDNMNRDIQIYSEKDLGIYNAMNRGIVRARGDYVIFLNSGDTFCDFEVLKHTASIIEKNGYGIYYGIVYRMYGNRTVGVIDYGKDKRTNYVKLLHAMAPNHQAIFSPLQCLKKFYFDEHYKYCADLDWFIKCYKDKIKLYNLNFVVSRYDISGVSGRPKVNNDLISESYNILKQRFPVWGRISVLCKRFRRFYCN